jgi:tubulin polyglutamylase TTLL4
VNFFYLFSLSDEDDPVVEPVPPEFEVNQGHLVGSAYKGRPGTILFDYPLGLNIQRNTSAFVITPMKTEIKVKYKSYWTRACVQSVCSFAGLHRTKGSHWTILWAKHLSYKEFEDLPVGKRVNHFPGSWSIGRKDNLNTHIMKMKRKHGDEFEILPEGHIFPKDRDSFCRYLDKEEIWPNKSKKAASVLWILKPLASSCGRGIRVITTEQALAIPKKKKCVVQQYLNQPYLINNRKFDMRVYVVVTSFMPLRVYVFYEGLARFASVDYSNDSRSKYIHLTNFSINKHHEGFKSLDAPQNDDMPSIKWTIAALNSYLESKGHDTHKLWNSIDEIVIKALITGESEITPKVLRHTKYWNNCYELYGFDIFLDHKLKPWLIEVNISPSLASESDLDTKVKSTLMADTLHLVGFQPLQSKSVPPGGFLTRSRTSSRNLSTKELAPRKIRDVNDLSSHDLDTILDLEDEAGRMGHFRRVYPTIENTDKFGKFFTCQRYDNLLYEKWLNSDARVHILKKLLVSPGGKIDLTKSSSRSAQKLARARMEDQQLQESEISQNAPSRFSQTEICHGKISSPNRIEYEVDNGRSSRNNLQFAIQNMLQQSDGNDNQLDSAPPPPPISPKMDKRQVCLAAREYGEWLEMESV